MRSFIAIDIEPAPELKAFYCLLKSKYQHCRINWVNEKIFHLTLAFLGDISQDRFKSISDGLEGIAVSSSVFVFSLSGVGFFGTMLNPRVLWIGVEDNPRLNLLQKDVATCVRNCGIDLEKRDFSPHLTLGRIKEREELHGWKRIVEENSKTLFQQVTVDKFCLYKSELTSRGAVYTVLREYPLRRD